MTGEQPPARNAASNRLNLAAVLLILAAFGAVFLSQGDERFWAIAGRLTNWVLALWGAVIVALGASLVGGFAIPRRGLKELSFDETVLFVFAAGSVVLPVIVFTGAVVSVPLAWGLVVGCVALKFWVRWPLTKSHEKLFAYFRGVDRPSVPGGLVMVPVGVAVMMLLAVSLTPPLLYDVTEYHLGALSTYQAASDKGANFAFVPMAFNFYGRFPFPVESLYFLGAWLSGPADFAPKLLNAFYVLSCGALILAWLRRANVPPGWRLLALLGWLAHPLVLEISLDAYIDAGSAFLVLSGLYVLALAGGFMHEEKGEQSAEGKAWLLPLAGLLTGGALATKYTVAHLFLLPMLVLFLVPALRRCIREKQWIPIGWAVLLGAVPLAVWLGKNWVWYGNPLEPFFEGLFKPGDVAAIAREKFYIESHYPQSFLSAQYWMKLSTRLGSFGWPWLAPLVALPVIAQRRLNVRLLVFVVMSYMLWNLVRESQPRFMLPSVALIIILGASGLGELCRNGGRVGKMAAAVAALGLGTACCGNLVLQFAKLNGSGIFDYALKLDVANSNRRDWQLDRLRADFYRKNLGSIGEVAADINTSRPLEKRVMLVYEARPYIFVSRTVYNTVFDDSELLRIAKGAKSGDEIVAKLKEAGLTHVVVNREELRRFIEQYARSWQLEKLGIENVRAQFGGIAAPEDLYPPFYRSPDWEALRGPVREFLAMMRKRAIVVKGRAPEEVYLAPL
ncbi:MAG: hypothetical protein K1X53_01195 [Candidatus Sumerlaeaceae bacterium]|nr:hypothetical protein [Candidatus Sumerlaeaceae bacterium]